MSGTGIGHTSALGLFPGGNAECGAADMSGNVWECCEDGDDEQQKEYRLWRGGAFIDAHVCLRCRNHTGGDPSDRYLSIGFRVVCARESARRVSAGNA